jgi:CTP:molybdopterin cytidylyltransferase MocA
MTSVHVGIDAARHAGATVVVIGLADQPGVTSDAWNAVASAARGGAPIAVATYDGRRANPVALGQEVWSLLATDGDEGARTLMRSREDLVVPVSCSGSPFDIDTVEDLHTWQNS